MKLLTLTSFLVFIAAVTDGDTLDQDIIGLKIYFIVLSAITFASKIQKYNIFCL